MQCDGHIMEVHIGDFPPIMYGDIKSGCMDFPRQRCPLLLREGNKCVQNDGQPIQGLLTHGNE